MSDRELTELQEVVRDRYEVEGLLGRGGMGAVYRARHLSLDAPVAIKILPVPASVGADELARFRREAMLAARLPNPHIVPVYEFEIREDLAYLVMPLVDGVSLSHRIATEGRLPLDEVRALIEQVGGALAFAHERGIVHRDVKPANILWEPANRRWLITDFGIARPVERTGDDITSMGAVMGTPAYMAPEQAAGGDVDARTDLYSLGATVCEALTGMRLKPFADRTDAFARYQDDPLHLPARLAEALAAALALAAAERPQTVRAWLEMIQAAERPPRRGLMAAAVVVAAVATVAGLAAVLGPPAPSAATEREVIAVLPFVDNTTARLGDALPAVFEEELRYVPSVEVVPAVAVASVVEDADLAVPATRDTTVAAVLRQFRASGVIVGTLEEDSAGLRLTAQLRRAEGAPVAAPTIRGPPDSLAAMVVSAVLELFDLRSEQTPYRAAMPGGGLAARMALSTGDSLFRAGDYDGAIARYRRVLNLDSTYALAAFKRTLAEVLRAQPTRASRSVRTALEPVQRYRENLDPLNSELLRAYEILVVEGNVEGAHQLVTDLVARYPFSVDALFVKGYLEFYFGPLFGTPPEVARFALERAEDLSPRFAVIHGILAFIAFQEGNDDRAREELRAYLAIDSTSHWAAAARLADSVRFRGLGGARRALERLDERPTSTLELIALAGKSLSIEAAERLVAVEAARALQERASSAEERASAFRLQLGNALGAGRAATVDTLFQQARRRNVPRAEVDRWAVLLAVTDLHALPDSEATEAARRLATDTTAPDGPWLAARWLREREPATARRAREALRRLANAGGGPALQAASLYEDLEALDLLGRGDTAGAYEQWARATKRFQFEEVPFGLVASLWPLRLTWARTAARRGDAAEVVTATATFEVSPGFVDQVARPMAIPLRADALEATGDGLAARDLRRRYAAVLEDATGRWAAVRDSLLARSGMR